jgi:hypothetical protein
MKTKRSRNRMSWRIRRGMKVRRKRLNKMTNYLENKETKRKRMKKRRRIWMKWIRWKISKRLERLFPKYKR